MRTTTGLRKLDSMLGGGYPQNSVVLLSGGPGTGKTLFSLKFLLEGARKGERCCFVTLNETKEEVLKACSSVKALSGVKRYIDKTLAIEHIPMGQSNISMKRFIDIIASYPKIERIVIDNVNKLLMFSESEKSYRAYLIELINGLKCTNSSLLLCETTDDESIDSGRNESFECDGIIQLIFLELEEKPMRALIIHKMRYTNFDAKLPHELVIDSTDIRLTDTKVI